MQVIASLSYISFISVLYQLILDIITFFKGFQFNQVIILHFGMDLYILYVTVSCSINLCFMSDFEFDSRILLLYSNHIHHLYIHTIVSYPICITCIQSVPSYSIYVYFYPASYGACEVREARCWSRRKGSGTGFLRGAGSRSPTL